MKKAVVIFLVIFVVLFCYPFYFVATHNKIGSVFPGGLVLQERKVFKNMDECSAQIKKVVEATSGILNTTEKHEPTYGDATFISITTLKDGGMKLQQCVQNAKDRTDYTLLVKPAKK